MHVLSFALALTSALPGNLPEVPHRALVPLDATEARDASPRLRFTRFEPGAASTMMRLRLSNPTEAPLFIEERYCEPRVETRFRVGDTWSLRPPWTEDDPDQGFDPWSNGNRWVEQPTGVLEIPAHRTLLIRRRGLPGATCRVGVRAAPAPNERGAMLWSEAVDVPKPFEAVPEDVPRSDSLVLTVDGFEGPFDTRTVFRLRNASDQPLTLVGHGLYWPPIQVIARHWDRRPGCFSGNCKSIIPARSDYLFTHGTPDSTGTIEANLHTGRGNVRVTFTAPSPVRDAPPGPEGVAIEFVGLDPDYAEDGWFHCLLINRTAGTVRYRGNSPRRPCYRQNLLHEDGSVETLPPDDFEGLLWDLPAGRMIPVKFWEVRSDAGGRPCRIALDVRKDGVTETIWSGRIGPRWYRER